MVEVENLEEKLVELKLKKRKLVLAGKSSEAIDIVIEKLVNEIKLLDKDKDKEIKKK